MLRFASLGLLLFAGSLFAQDNELRSLTGKNLTGTLTQITPSEVVFTTKEGKVGTPLAKVLAIQINKTRTLEGIKQTNVALLDDTLLHCTAIAFKGKDLQTTLTSGISVTVPLNFVAAINREAENAGLQKKWLEVAKQKVKRDRIVIQREGELNPLEGVLGDPDEKGEKIDFKREGADTIAVPLEKLHGLIFYRTEGSSETPTCRVTDKDGTTLLATKIAFDQDQLTLTTTFGSQVSIKRDALSLLDFNMGKLTYLSDMTPGRVVERSGIGLIVKYQKDSNLDGDQILLGSQTFAKGLSMHAYTDLEYNLGGQYKDLKGVLGVDPRTGAESQATVTIYCDGEKQFQEVISAKSVRPISINVKDTQKLRIVVSSRDFTNLHDHVTFADARVSQ